MASQHVIGIDLGTTNTCAAVYRDGHSQIIYNEQGKQITPSCVAFSRTGRVVGEGADFRDIGNIANIVTDIKRMMGRNFNDPYLQRMRLNWPFRVINVNNKPSVEVSLYGRKVRFAPEELSAMILSKMKLNAEAALNGPVNEAVITVPAYFNNAQRQATKDAGIIAGFDKLRILSEPTAGALAYGFNPVKNKPNNILVFDLGGGTLDVSLLNVKNQRFFVRATSGNSNLGGEDFTTRLVEHFINEFNKKHKMDISCHPRAVFKLRKACEQAKCLLASAPLVKISVGSLFNNIDLCSELSCDEFDALCRDLVASCLRCIENLLKDTNLTPQHIDQVILTGGSSRIKKVQYSISKLFGGKDIKRSFSMDEAAARGAAIYASQTRGRVSTQKGGLATDVTPFSLGIEVIDDCMEVVVPKNTPIPVTISKEFTTVDDNQKSVVCAIYEGEHISTKKNQFLGSFILESIQRAKKGVPALEVTFNIDRDGIIVVSEEDTKTKISHQIKINGHSNLQREEIEEMIQVCRYFTSIECIPGPKPLNYLKKAEAVNNIIKLRAVPWSENPTQASSIF